MILTFCGCVTLNLSSFAQAMEGQYEDEQAWHQLTLAEVTNTWRNQTTQVMLVICELCTGVGILFLS